MIPIGTTVTIGDGDLIGEMGVIVSRDPDTGLALVRVARDRGRHAYDEVADALLLNASPPCTPHSVAGPRPRG